MSRTSKRAKLTLNPDQKHTLEQTAQSRRRPQREVQRARVLLHYASGQSVTAIAQALRLSRVAVYKWIDRALALEVESTLRDQYHRPKEPTITEEAKAWVSAWPAVSLKIMRTPLRFGVTANWPSMCVSTLGSWLNLIETLFAKMARTFLRHIRVGSLQELKGSYLARRR